MNEFKTSRLNEKYSIPVHTNKADLMAELNNIMGDESDVELIEPRPHSSKDNEHKNGVLPSAVPAVKGAGDANGSKFNGSHSMQTSDSSDTSDSTMAQRDATDATDDGPGLSWAQNHSQSLSMCVASILSDHDYLSQGDLLRIIESNEESLELEKQSQKQREINDNVISNSTLPKDPNTDSQRTIIYEQEPLDGATHSASVNEKPASDKDIEVLNEIVQKLKSSKSEEKSVLFDQILEKVKQLKSQTDGNTETAVKVEKEEPKDNCTAQNQSRSTSDFSSNHSEPMEYYGGPKFSTQSSVEETKENDGMLTLLQHFECIFNFDVNYFQVPMLICCKQ